MLACDALRSLCLLAECILLLLIEMQQGLVVTPSSRGCQAALPLGQLERDLEWHKQPQQSCEGCHARLLKIVWPCKGHIHLASVSKGLLHSFLEFRLTACLAVQMEQGGDEEEPEPAMNGAEDDDGADFLLKDDTNDIDLRCEPRSLVSW